MNHTSNSEIQTFKRCKRKWYLSYVLRLTLNSDSAGGPLWVGTMVHSGVEGFHTAGLDPTASHDDCVAAGYAMLKAKVDEKIEEGMTIDPKELDLATIMLEGFYQWSREENHDAFSKVEAVELELELDLGNGFIYIGKLDSLEHDLRTGFLRVVDTKTCQSLTDPTFMLQMNEQMMGYVMLARNHFEEHVDGALFSMLRKVKRTGTAKPPFYARHEMRYNKQELATFQERLVHVTDEMRQLEARVVNEELEVAVQLAYPTPNDTCSWQCEYIAICPMFNDGSNVRHAIAENFHERDPLERYKTLLKPIEAT